MKKPKLLNCPLCHSTDVYAQGYPMSGWLARCDNCGCRAEGKQWNHRISIEVDKLLTDDNGETVVSKPLVTAKKKPKLRPIKCNTCDRVMMYSNNTDKNYKTHGPCMWPGAFGCIEDDGTSERER